jgi:hypothetical protein
MVLKRCLNPMLDEVISNEPEWALPFQFMRVGDSFFIPTLKPALMLYIVDTRAKDAGVRIRAFTTKHEGYLGVRVWRTR